MSGVLCLKISPFSTLIYKDVMKTPLWGAGLKSPPRADDQPEQSTLSPSAPLPVSPRRQKPTLSIFDEQIGRHAVRCPLAITEPGAKHRGQAQEPSTDISGIVTVPAIKLSAIALFPSQSPSHPGQILHPTASLSGLLLWLPAGCYIGSRSLRRRI